MDSFPGVLFLLSMFILLVICLTVLLLSYTSSGRSRSFASSDFPSSDSEYRTFLLAQFPILLLLLLLLQEDFKHTVLSFRLLRAFSLRLVYEHGQKDPSAFFRRPHFKVSIRLLFQAREYWCQNQIVTLIDSGVGYDFYPLFFCSCRLSGKVFHETFLFIPNAP